MTNLSIKQINLRTQLNHASTSSNNEPSLYNSYHSTLNNEWPPTLRSWGEDD